MKSVPVNYNTTKKQTVKEKLRNAKLGLRGQETNNWRGGKTNERVLLMSQAPYKNWRKMVFERDKYTCQICNQLGGKLEADHIKEWSNYPEYRYDVNNGRTLCKSCHKQTDNYGAKGRKKHVLSL